jgi:hypothetical protein
MDLEYKQGIGFVGADIGEFGWREGEDDEQWAKRVGCHPVHIEDDEVLAATSVMLFERDGLRVPTPTDGVKSAESGVEPPFCGFALMSVLSFEVFDAVVCRTPADWLAFRLSIAPAMHASQATCRLEILAMAAARTFRATHGHEAYSACTSCESDEERRRRQGARLKAKRAPSIAS